MSKIVLLDRYYIPKELLATDDLWRQFQYSFEDYGTVTIVKNFSWIKNYFVVPSGSWHKIASAVKDTEVIDKRELCTFPEFPPFTGTLYENQLKVVDEFLKIPSKSGFIHSKPGSGKTVMACKILSELKQRFLVIVPTSLLLEQWKERLETFNPGIKVARLGLGHDAFDPEVHHGLIAIINSLRAPDKIEKYRTMFGAIVLDEAHRLPANTYKETINKLSAVYKIGLSANTTRKDLRHVMIEDYLGPHCVVNTDPTVWQAEVHIINTGFPFMFNSSMNWSRTLNAVCGNPEYNKFIAQRVHRDLIRGRKVAVLTPRLFQIEELLPLLDGTRVGIITGSVKQDERNKIIEQVNAGLLDVLLCSKQIFEEGVDIKRLDTIHLVAPSNNIEKLEQAIGRVERVYADKQPPRVYDYWFIATTPNSYWNQQKIRLEFYKERGYHIVMT